jgi:hypothetical protein
MSIPRNLGNFADNVDTNGQVSLTTGVTGSLPVANGGTGSTSTTFVNAATNVTGTLPVANGGTGAATLTANNVLLGNGTSALQAVAPGANGNILTSNGTTWTSSTPAAGGVTSVATGNGLSGGTITSTGTLTIAAPSFNSVGSYAMAGLSNTSSITAGSNYAAGTGGTQVKGLVLLFNAFSNNLSGTWKAMGGTYSTSPCLAGGMGSVFVRVS